MFLITDDNDSSVRCNYTKSTEGFRRETDHIFTEAKDL